MPISSAELSIILEVQDRASAQLRQVGAQVQRLEQQVEGVQRSTSRAGGFFGGLQLGAGIQAAQSALQGLGGLVDLVRTSVIDLNSNLEQSTATFTALTGSVGAAQSVIAALRREAATSPFSDAQTIAAGRTLITVADGTVESLTHLVQVSERLAAIDPAQGLEGAAVALREALSGDFQSIAERFELSRQSIQRFRDQGLTNLQAVEAELQRLGVTSELVERLGRTFEGRRATIVSFFDELRQRLGSGIFERISDLFGHMVNLIAQHGDRLRQLATNIGQAIGAILERVATAAQGPIRALLNTFAPGLWEAVAAELARLPEPLQQTTRAAQEAVPVVQSLERQLAGIGVAAAEQQQEADRVRRAYEAQLEPLQRQLQVLQDSADLQRVQNALASNQAAVRRIQLERELAALQRAAGPNVDPNAPGLTLRQRMIALALEERRLQLEQLGIEEDRRPAIQSLQQQIATITEQQRQALAPIQAQLDAYKQQADVLNLIRQRSELARQDAEAAAAAMRKTWTEGNDPEALDAARKRGEELAAQWLKGWQDWIEQGGGTVWGAMAKSLDDWWTLNGQPLAARIGGDLGKAIGDTAAASFQAAFADRMDTLERIERIVQFLTDPGGTLRRIGMQAAPPPPILGLPRVTRPEGSDVGPNQLTGGGPGVTISVEPGAVQVNGQPDAVRTADLKEFLRQALEAYSYGLAASASGMDNTAVGVQGAGRR
jgi:hypothetical protein